MYNRNKNPRPSVRTMRIPAPKRGWIRAENLATADRSGAEVLDNYFPTTEGARLRHGSAKYATVGGSVTQIMPYHAGAGGALFAATATDIYDITSPVDTTTVPTSSMSNLSSGDWSYVQFSTTAGDYLYAVNGTDYAVYYNTSLEPIGDQAVNELSYDALSAEFSPNTTLTGATSGATATIYAVEPATSLTGTLKLGTISGTFQDNETITDSATGSATVNGVASAGSTIAITGVSTRSLSQVWSFKSRLWFVEKNSLSAWYLPTSSLGGAATEFPLGPVFQRGGSLLMGATWSIDAGSGIDDVCLFITDQGEVAVYQGTDPASASTWALVGVYQIGKPLNKNATFKAGGDLAVMTEDGIIPISAAIRKDRVALQGVAITAPIEDAWRDAVANRSVAFPFTATLWQSATMLVVGVPAIDGSSLISYVANARTGAWCRFTGWDVRCAGVYQDNFYFGTSSSTIMQGETGGSDDGQAYTGVWVPKFSDDASPNYKMASHARLRARGTKVFRPTIQAFADNTIGSYDAVSTATSTVGATWGLAVWGTDVWGAPGSGPSQTDWQTVSAAGVSLTPAIQVASNSTQEPSFELIAADLIYEEGALL